MDRKRISPDLRVLIFIAGIAAFCLVVACKPTTETEEKSSATSVSDSLSLINEAINLHPEDPENYVRRAQYSSRQANYGDAIIDMSRAMKIDSVNVRYHEILADIYLKSAKSRYALGTMERAVQLFPDSIPALLKLAELELILKQYDRLSTTLRHVLTLKPQNTRALFLLGLMYQEQGDLEHAIQSFQTVVELNSEDAESWTMLGNLLDIKGDPTALQCFDNAIDADPEYPQGWHSKAFYLQNHGDVAQAIEIYKHIHQIDSSYADAWLNRGILYLETDSLIQAKSCFDKYIHLDSTSAIGYYYAGSVAESLGDRTIARTYLGRALELEPGSERVKKALEAIK